MFLRDNNIQSYLSTFFSPTDFPGMFAAIISQRELLIMSGDRRRICQNARGINNITKTPGVVL